MRFISKPLIIAGEEDVFSVGDLHVPDSVAGDIRALVDYARFLVETSVFGDSVNADGLSDLDIVFAPMDETGLSVNVDIEAQVCTLPDFNRTVPALVSSPYFSNMLVYLLIKAIRAAHQQTHNAVLFSRVLDPFSTLVRARILAADEAVFAARVVMAARGDDAGLWRSVLSGDDGAVARTLDQTGQMDASLCSWFSHEDTVSLCDRLVLDRMDAGEFDLKENRKDHRAFDPSAFAPFICRDEMGRSYMRPDACMVRMDDPIIAAHLGQIIREYKTVTCNNVTFRDRTLARRLFPDMA